MLTLYQLSPGLCITSYKEHIIAYWMVLKFLGQHLNYKNLVIPNEAAIFPNISITLQLYWSKINHILKQRLNLNYQCARQKSLESSVGIVAKLKAEWLEFNSWQGARDFFFSIESRLVLGPNQPPIQWILGLCLNGKAAGAWSWPLISTSCWG
jgi:hypothetical protein